MCKAPRITPVTPVIEEAFTLSFKETKNVGIRLNSLKSSLLESITLAAICACNGLVSGSGVLKQHSNNCLHNQICVNGGCPEVSGTPIGGDSANIHVFQYITSISHFLLALELEILLNLL